MQINTVVETAEGQVEVVANLTDDQVKFLLEVGLNVVLAKGAKPFLTKDDYPEVQLHDGNQTAQ